MTLEAPNSPRQTPSSGEKSSGGSAGSGNTVLNGQNSAGLRALLRACMLVDLNDAQLKSEAGTDGLGRRTRAEKGPLEEEKAPGEGETVPGRGQTGPGKEETIPGKGDVFPSEGEEGPGKEKELVLSTSTDFPPKLLGVKVGTVN